MAGVIWGLLALLFLGSACKAQMVPVKSVDSLPSWNFITVNYGIVSDPARKLLESAWSTSPVQVERAYCISLVRSGAAWDHDSAGRKLGLDLVYDVVNVYPAKVENATTGSIESIECAPGEPVLHIHTPTTCDNDDDNCEYGGPNAFQCQPSRTDYITLLHSRHKFAVIQCGKEEFRFYWPHEYRPYRVPK